MIDTRSRPSFDPLLLGCLLVSLAVNVGLGLQWRSRAAEAPAVRPAVRELAEGARVPPIVGRSAAGEPMRVDVASGKPLVLYVFSSSCGWCDQNLENVRTLAAAVGDRYRVVGLSLDDDVAVYLARERLTFDVVVGVPRATLAALAVRGTPQTLVISPDGRLLKVWHGAWRGPLAQQVEQFFGLTLPGLVVGSRTPSFGADSHATPRPS
jgi:peroxiredoxin